MTLASDTALIGAQGDNTAAGTDAGSAYAFVRNGTTWRQQARLTARDAAAGDQFGSCVTLAGDTALVGASGDTTNRGSVRVFTRSGTTWTEQAKLTASDG